MDTHLPAYLTPLDVARVLRCSKAHVYNLISTGELKACRIGQRLLRVARSELRRYLDCAEAALADE